jgi:transketolase
MQSMRERFVDVTTRLLDDDPHLALVMADIGVAQFAATGAVRRHPHRVINVGIREQLLISFAAGMALEGFRPIVHTYAPFLVERPFEQVRLDLGHQEIGAILVSVGASYDSAASGRTHQAPEDVALIASLPGWQIHVPGHPDEAELFLRRAASGAGRVYIRLSEETNASAVEVSPGEFALVKRGSQSSATVVAVGPMLDRVMGAVSGFDVNVLYAPTVRPFDGQILRVVLRAPEVIIVEPYLAGTSAAEIAAALIDIPHRLLSIGVRRIEHRHYGTAAEHAAAHGLDADGLRSRIGAFLHRSTVREGH